MMGRWGLEGMRSFEQVNVARKEVNNIPHSIRRDTAGHVEQDLGLSASAR